jgi:hypothetical protein
MLASLHVEGFRGLRSLSVERLARINLIVGQNQSGKTSLLDAVQLLLDRGSPRALHDCQARRNEVFVVRRHDDGSQTIAPRLDSLFHGGKLHPGARIKLAATADTPTEVEFTVEEHSAELPRLRGGRRRPEWAEALSRLAIRVRDDSREGVALPIPHDEASLRTFLNRGRGDEFIPAVPDTLLDFVDVSGLDPTRLIELWGSVPLTPREQEVVQAMQLIEPDLAGIALIPGLWSDAPSELVVKLRTLEERLQLGDMGEGFRRLLGLLLVLPDTPRQQLLVDEIDTGLHYSVLEPMWQLVLAEARRRDLQIFATTHSWDCVAALGKLYESDPGVDADVRLHRIDRGSDRTTTYSGDEILFAAQQHLEVRG